MVMAKASYAYRSLGYLDGTDSSVIIMDAQYRTEIATTFNQQCQDALMGLYPESNAFHWFVKQLVSVIHGCMQLLAVQPVQGTTDAICSGDPQGTALPLAVQFLQTVRNVYQDPRIAPYRWYMRLFIPWHGLAVAMDQVCACNDAFLQVHYQPLIAELYLSLQEMWGSTHHDILEQPLRRFTLLSQTLPNQVLVDEGFVQPQRLQLF
jgi:hypothetical protein